MSTWIQLDSQAAVDDVMDAFDGFHDACFREASITAETYVDERGGMHCPGHLDTSVVMFFQSQGARHLAIEVACRGVSQFRVSSTPDNCDSILGGAAFSREGPLCRLGFSFVGGPLTGPPNGSLEIVERSNRGARRRGHRAGNVLASRRRRSGSQAALSIGFTHRGRLTSRCTRRRPRLAVLT